MAEVGFASIPRAIQRDRSIGPFAKLVYLALSSRADKRLRAWPSLATIAAESSISKRSAQRGLDELERRGLVTVVEERIGRSNIYQLGAPTVVPETMVPQTIVPETRGGGPTDHTTVVPQTTEVTPSEEEPLTNTTSSEQPPPPQVLTEGQRLAPGICDHLSRRLTELRVKHTIGNTWLQAAARMVDLDHREPEEILAVIDWSLNDSFWQANIHSLPTLRAKYDKLRLQMNRPPPQHHLTLMERNILATQQYAAQEHFSDQMGIA